MAIYRKADATRNAKMDAMTALYNGGSLEWRSGAIPASPSVADSGILLATNTAANPSFTAAIAGQATYNVDTPNIQVGVGDIGHCRAKTAAGVVIADFDVGVAAEAIIVDKIAVGAGEMVTVTSFTLTEAV